MTADWNLDFKATALDPMRQTLNPLFGASSTEVLNMDLPSAFLKTLPEKKQVSVWGSLGLSRSSWNKRRPYTLLPQPDQELKISCYLVCMTHSVLKPLSTRLHRDEVRWWSPCRLYRLRPTEQEVCWKPHSNPNPKSPIAYD